jgi:hypothetical protein
MNAVYLTRLQSIDKILVGNAGEKMKKRALVFKKILISEAKKRLTFCLHFLG